MVAEPDNFLVDVFIHDRVRLDPLCSAHGKPSSSVIKHCDQPAAT
jgi:hypothetical protein